MAFSGSESTRRIILLYLPPMTTCSKFLTALAKKRDEITAENNKRETKEKTRVTLANQEDEL